eukprot:6182342-Pleurochrysis_carterae.AAC.2
MPSVSSLDRGAHAHTFASERVEWARLAVVRTPTRDADGRCAPSLHERGDPPLFRQLGDPPLGGAACTLSSSIAIASHCTERAFASPRRATLGKQQQYLLFAVKKCCLSRCQLLLLAFQGRLQPCHPGIKQRFTRAKVFHCSHSRMQFPSSDIGRGAHAEPLLAPCLILVFHASHLSKQIRMSTLCSAKGCTYAANLGFCIP